MPGDFEVWSVVLDRLTGRLDSKVPARALRVAAQAAVITAVVGGTVAYTDHGRDITLVTDGRPVGVQSGADDVRGLLAEEGVTLSARDLVAPDLDVALSDGQKVVVRFARPVTVTVDGVPKTYWTTELTVDAALKSLGIRAEGARVSASRSLPLGRSGLDLVVSYPKTVTVAADGRTRQVRTTAATVADLLAEQGVTVRAADQLSALPASPVVEGVVVAITRIDRRRVTVTENVRPPVEKRPDPRLAKGEETVVTAGRAGTRTATYTVTLADGQEAGRSLVSATVVRRPIGRVVKVGTRATPKTGSISGADGLNWAALARCESGGNPRAVNPAGYYGLYQFSPSTWHSVGGSGMPHDAAPGEQLYRAKLLYKKAGAGQWGCGRQLFG